MKTKFAAFPLMFSKWMSVAVVYFLVACGGSGNNGSSSSSPRATASGPGTSTAGVECSYSYSALNNSTSVKLTSTATWTCSSTARALTANGIPDHEVGTSTANPNSIATQTVTASLSILPAPSAATTELGGPRGTTGYILNGVKIDASTAGSCDNTATNCSLIENNNPWSIEAISGKSKFDFGTDTSNGHVQPGGAYHYHGMPEGFITKRGGSSSKMTLIGWAADGFPIYARYGYSVATSASSALKVIKSSYQLVSTAPSTRPSVSTYPLGTFKQDWVYTAGSGDLDECNGRTGVTPEFPNGIYHYYATDTYPYLQRCVKGAL